MTREEYDFEIVKLFKAGATYREMSARLKLEKNYVPSRIASLRKHGVKLAKRLSSCSRGHVDALNKVLASN